MLFCEFVRVTKWYEKGSITADREPTNPSVGVQLCSLMVCAKDPQYFYNRAIFHVAICMWKKAFSSMFMQSDKRG